MTPRETGIALPVGQHEDVKDMIERQRNREYNKLRLTGKIGQVHGR